MCISRTRGVARAAAVMALVVGSAGCGDSSERELVDSANRYLEKGDRQAAIVELKSAIQKDPQSSEARLLFGKTLLMTGAASLAVVELEKARVLNASETAVAPSLAKALLASGQSSKVVKRYAETELADSAALSSLKTTLALAFFEQNVADRSETAIDAALQLDGKNPVALLHKARLKGLRFQTEEALALVAQVLRDDAKNLQALQLRGDLLLGGKRNVDAATLSYREALKVDDKYLAAHVALISLAQNRKDSQAFRAQIAALTKALPKSFHARYYEAQIALADANLTKAREIAQDLLRVAPSNPELLLLAGTIELRNGALLAAEGHLGKAQQLLPDSPVVRQTLAQTYLRAGQGAKALPVLAPLLAQQPPDAEALTLAAQAQLQVGDKAASDSLFAQAIKVNPTDPRLLSALALAQIYRGDADEGFKQLESLAAKDPGVASDMALISARLRANELPSALEAIDRLFAKAPNRPLPHYLRGRALLQQDDPAGARQAFDKALASDPRHYPSVAGLAAIDLAEQKPDEAGKRFKALLARDPGNTGALLALVELRQRAGAPAEEVEALLVNAIRINPAEPLLRPPLVSHYLVSRNIRAALGAAREAVAALPGDMRVLDLLGEAQIAAGELQQAVSTLTRAATMQPRKVEPQIRLAYAHMRVGDAAAASKALRRALELSPNYLQAQRGLVQIALSQQRYDDAAKLSRDIQKQQPTLAIGYVLESEVRAKERKWDAAIVAAVSAFDREKTGHNAARLYVLYKSAGKTAQAEVVATDWERQKPNDAAFQQELGAVALADRKYAEAESRFRRVSELQPNDAVTLNNVAWLLSEQRKPGATAFAQRAQKLLPDSVSIVDTLATALAAENRLDEAVEWRRKAVAMAPEGAYYRLKLARLLVEKGDKAQARRELGTLANLGNRFPDQEEVSRLLKAL